MSTGGITILGGKGMLGSDLKSVAESRGLAVRTFDLPEVDITDEEQIRRIVSSSPLVVNCAAYTNVEKAESEPELADRVNGYAVGMLGKLAKSAGIPVVHISTDFVFDGRKDGPYNETDAPGPLSAYGRSKWLGERLLSESGCEQCVIRVQWTYGRHGVNFITKILNAAQTQPSLKVVDDQVGSPTCTRDVAQAICDLLQLPAFPRGLYHLAASGYVSRYEMTRTLLDLLKLETDVVPCRTSDFKTVAARPLNSRFDCTKLNRLLKTPLRSWQDMLKDYLETL
jgi:dTDP-4-dehydrorhamnose reductase